MICIFHPIPPRRDEEMRSYQVCGSRFLGGAMSATAFRPGPRQALFLAAALAGSVGAAANRPPKLYTIEQFMATTAVSGASFSPDETKLLFSSNGPGIFNAYVVPLKDGEATHVTASTTDTTLAVSYFPKDERILFTHDQGGNELNHLSVLD